MARLLILRHGKTEMHSKSGKDFDRELVARGVEDSKAMGQYIKKHILIPEVVLVSPAKRTSQTVSHVLEGMAAPLESIFDERIYNASSTTLFEVLQKHAPHAKSVLIIGHNPGMILLTQMLIATRNPQLLGAITHFPTCALADLSFEAETIADIKNSTGELLALLKPKALRN